MPLPILEKVANSNLLLSGAITIQLFCMYLLSQFVQRLESLAGDAGSPPDLRVGFTENELYAWYDTIGAQGRAIYRDMYRLDLFPFMASYSIVLGVLLLQQTQEAGMEDSKLPLVFFAQMWFDFMETVLIAYGSETYPQRMSYSFVQIAIGANELKWFCFGLGMLLLSVLFLYNTLFPKKKRVKEETKKE